MRTLLNTENMHPNRFIASDPNSMDAFSLAHRVAQFQVPVLITGETGAGKECIAKYIHEHAFDEEAPYVGVNCAAIPENMLEAILFGYEKGAFTGAITRVAGKFEQANGGTLLLDEIGDMPMALQVKLLRVLQENMVERLGGSQKIPLDIRIIASTNKDLSEEMACGRFREDLYYRIAVMPIHVAPLRERPQDILPLARHFIRKYHQFHGADIHLSGDACQALVQHSWPGNVRELENVIQRGLILCDGKEIHARDFGLGHTSKEAAGSHLTPAGEIDSPQPPIHRMKQQGRLAEYHYLLELLRRHDGNKSRTAAFLGITPRALRYRLAAMREDGLDIAASAN
ncbi:sigma-54 dependent transcriptional regulator [Mangrovibacter phragmitis]|uniref:sigma-54 interaction domain-containing protein n=1 Tax=Mangrovibacter phragmitis TaxID=1691903 RepID=UPI00336A0D2F